MQKFLRSLLAVVEVVLVAALCTPLGLFAPQFEEE